MGIDIELEKKVLSCHGKLTYKSIAKVLNIRYHRVYLIMSRNGKEAVISESAQKRQYNGVQ